MKLTSKNNFFRSGVCSFAPEKSRLRGFSLMESVAAVVVLGIVCSGILLVFNRCMNAVTDSKMKMQALEVARENMEELLTQDSVQEKVEYGTSEKYPEIEWETKVEPFYEPVTEQMWVQAICKAEYNSSEDEREEVKLVHWLTNLTKQQLLEMIKQKEEYIEYSPEQIVSGIEGATEYAGVDVTTIQSWVENGMPLSEDGEFIKPQLDLYKNTGGSPTEQQKKQTLLDLSQEEIKTQTEQSKQQDEPTEQPSKPQDQQPSEPEETQQQDSQREETTEREQQDDDYDQQPDQQQEQQQEQQPSNNPLGLPDGYQNWSIGEIIQWLKENGHF